MWLSEAEDLVRPDDRGDDFYEWFLGPRMIYTSGVSFDPNVEQTLEQLQDNKLSLVCHKLDLQPSDKYVASPQAAKLECCTHFHFFTTQIA